MAMSLWVFILWSFGFLIIYCLTLKICIGIDDLCKSNYLENKMYKYKRWMSFILIFRFLEDTLDNIIKEQIIAKENEKEKALFKLNRKEEELMLMLDRLEAEDKIRYQTKNDDIQNDIKMKNR